MTQLSSLAKEKYWYLASYPKSGNTWCRLFITELQRISNKKESQEVLEELNLNSDLHTGMITSSRVWLTDQLGINSCDLSYKEIDLMRGKCGETQWLFSDGERFHKTHDAFTSIDSNGRPIVCTSSCNGAIYIIRNPEDIVISLSHFFQLDLEEAVEFILNPHQSLSEQSGAGHQQVRQFMGSWDSHVSSWVDQEVLPTLVIKYEDMKLDSIATFTKLANFLNLPTDKDLITKAIENTSIEKLKKMESDVGGFAEKPSGCDRFFRSGQVGEGSEKLSLKKREKIYDNFSKIMDRYGYAIKR